jgi:hypothetical protein
MSVPKKKNNNKKNPHGLKTEEGNKQSVQPPIYCMPDIPEPEHDDTNVVVEHEQKQEQEQQEGKPPPRRSKRPTHKTRFLCVSADDKASKYAELPHDEEANNTAFRRNCWKENPNLKQICLMSNVSY